jgi:two-component system, NarL family, sensor kinase
LKKLTISQKLILSYLLIGIFTVIIISFIFYLAFKNALTERTSAQLSSINVLKKARIEDYFLSRKKSFEVFIRKDEIEKAFICLEKNGPAGEQCKSYFDELEKWEDDFDYKNMWMFNKDFQPLNPDTSFLSQKFISSPQIRSFLESASGGYIVKDFSKEIPGNDKVVLLVASPVKNARMETIGMLLLQTDFKKIENILYERTGMGNTGESYIIGNDFYMRSQSRFFPKISPLKIKVQTEASINAFKDIDGIDIIKDYRNEPVFSAYRKLNIEGLDWVIISEIDMKEAMMPIFKVRNYIIVTGLIIILLIVLITFYLSGKISSPILKLRDVVIELSRGKLPNSVIHNQSSDEIGQMVQAIGELIEGLKRTSDFAFKIGSGDFKSAFEPLSKDDVLGISLIQMRDKLKLLKEQEINFIRERSSVLLEGQENERKRIARELHDGIGQMLTAIKLRIGMMEGQADLQKEIKTILDETINEVRRVSFNLMPSVLIDFGLEAGLKLLCNNMGNYIDALIDLNFINSAGSSKLSFESSVSLYRIAQEALNNIIKYSEATKIELQVTLLKEKVIMEIKDNGLGFNLNKYQSDKGRQMNGIKNMKERAEILNGKFDITTKINGGTVIKVEVPV